MINPARWRLGNEGRKELPGMMIDLLNAIRLAAGQRLNSEHREVPLFRVVTSASQQRSIYQWRDQWDKRVWVDKPLCRSTNEAQVHSRPGDLQDGWQGESRVSQPAAPPLLPRIFRPGTRRDRFRRSFPASPPRVPRLSGWFAVILPLHRPTTARGERSTRPLI